MVQPFFRRPESSTAILIAATELAPPMSAYRLDMSFSTPMLMPGWLSFRSLTKGLIDQTIPWFAIAFLAPRRNAPIVARPRLIELLDAFSGIDVSGTNVALAVRD